MCFFFFILTQGTAGQGNSWSLRFSTGLEKSYLGWISQNSRTKNFFFGVYIQQNPYTITRHRIPSTAQKSVRRARVLGLAASMENYFVSCLKTRHLIIWSYIVLTPHATGTMGQFSYLWTCSKAKTFGYYSKEFACFVSVLCRKRLSTRLREVNFFLTEKNNPVLQQPSKQEVSMGLGFNNSSQMRAKLSIIIPVQGQPCHLHTPMGNLTVKGLFQRSVSDFCINRIDKVRAGMSLDGFCCVLWECVLS